MAAAYVSGRTFGLDVRLAESGRGSLMRNNCGDTYGGAGHEGRLNWCAVYARCWFLHPPGLDLIVAEHRGQLLLPYSWFFSGSGEPRQGIVGWPVKVFRLPSQSAGILPRIYSILSDGPEFKRQRLGRVTTEWRSVVSAMKKRRGEPGERRLKRILREGLISCNSFGHNFAVAYRPSFSDN